MADGAMIREMQPRIAQILRRDEQRILGQPRAGRGREMTRIASEHDFEFSGRGARTEAIMEEGSGHRDNQAEERCCDDDDQESSAFHGPVGMLMDEGRSD